MESKSKPVVIWLFTGAVLVFIMTAVGGITRLTESGLSMVDWNLFMGAIPPLSDEAWQETFNQYQQYPEFQTTHAHFTIGDFKRIFFWEYIHRLLGRVIGLVFIIPFGIFLLQKRIDQPLFYRLLFLLFMGAFQGFLGWYMVSSGLVNEPRVSHFRLAAHLSTAFFTISYSVWLALGIIQKNISGVLFSKKLKNITVVGLIILSIQIVFGAFVAGKDAGFIHNFWPNMNPGEFISPLVFDSDNLLLHWINNPSGIQFIHRYMAYIVSIWVVWLWAIAKKEDSDDETQRRFSILLIIVLAQFTLGVITLILQVPVILGVLHQLGALLLLLGFIYTLSLYRSTSQTISN